jgi:hypothetical protein
MQLLLKEAGTVATGNRSCEPSVAPPGRREDRDAGRERDGGPPRLTRAERGLPRD